MKTKQTWLAGVVIAFVALTLISWKKSENNQLPVKPYLIKYQEDTLKPRKKSTDKKEYRTGELDEAMKELDRAMAEMDKSMKIDFSKMDKDIKAAMEELKKVDFEKIGREVEASLKNIDWAKTRAEIDKAMREVEVTMKEVDKKQIKEQMAKAKEQLEAAKISSQIDMKKIKETVEKSMVAARASMEKAKKEMLLMKEFTEALEKDGLIDKKKGYKIDVKKGELFINDMKQSKEVNDKYRKYFKEEDYTIRTNGEGVESV